MSGTDPVERQMVATAAVILGQGDLVDRLSRGLTIASLAGLAGLATLTGFAAIPTILLLGAASLVGLIELWFAARVATDAALFRHLSVTESGPNWTLVDAALTALELLPAAKAGRPAGPRIAGAFRLLRYQTAALIGQFGLIVAGALAGAVR